VHDTREFVTHSIPSEMENHMSLLVNALIAVIIAVVVYFVATALGLPVIVAAVAAILVLLAGIGSGSRLGSGGRVGHRRGGVV
jgi:uncharacterized membrane protein